MIYDSNVQVLGEAPSFSQNTVRHEASVARVPIAEALSAGPAHRQFIDSLPDEWRNDPGVQIFSRLVYLKPGWFPLGPQYHFDWGGHLSAAGEPVETLMVLHGEASQTEFIIGPLEHPEVDAPDDYASSRQAHRQRWDDQVQAGLASGKLKQWYLEPNMLIRFDSRTLHRARPAKTTGWRVLIRAIRGLAQQTTNPGHFTTCRNAYIPTTDEQRAQFAPYQDRR